MTQSETIAAIENIENQVANFPPCVTTWHVLADLIGLRLKLQEREKQLLALESQALRSCPDAVCSWRYDPEKISGLPLCEAAKQAMGK